MNCGRTLVVSKTCNNNCINCLFLQKSSCADSYSETYLVKRLYFLKKKHRAIKTINITGGEPTLNNGLFGILKEARSLFRNAEISLLSNGRMFSYNDYNAKFCSLNIDNMKVAIPLYGHTAHIHDAATRVRGSFAQTTRGIKNLLDSNKLVEIRVIINRLNYKELHKIANFIFNKFDKVLFLIFIAMELNGNITKKRIAVRYAELRQHLHDALEYNAKNIPKIKLFHFPLCTVQQRYRGLIQKSIEDYKLSYAPQCDPCFYRKRCMGILKTYLDNIGHDEFSPIKNHKRTTNL